MEKKEGYKKTEIGWIPEDWKTVKIGTAVDKIIGGGTPSRECLDYYEGGIPWITVKDLSKNLFYKDSAIESISEEGLKNSSANLINENNIIIATRMGLGRGFINTCKLAINQDMKALYLNKDIMSNEFFLSWYLNNSDFIESLGTGTTVKGISLTTVKNLSLPLPPLPEQKKIADILTTVDDKISSIDSRIQQTEQLKKGLMEKLLTEGIGHTEFKETEIGRIPVGWDVIKLGEISDFINGRGFKPTEWGKVGLPIIRIQNLNGSEEYNYYDGAYAPKILVKNGELLFAWSGSRGTSFGPHIWYGGDGLLNYHTWKVEYSDHILRDFLFYELKRITVKIEREAHGASALVHMQKKFIVDYFISLPPYEEQKQIATILSTVDDKLDILTQKKSQYQTLKKGLSQQLLTGQMRVKV
jgi:type I restriction enzyme S subunit